MGAAQHRGPRNMANITTTSPPKGTTSPPKGTTSPPAKGKGKGSPRNTPAKQAAQFATANSKASGRAAGNIAAQAAAVPAVVAIACKAGLAVQGQADATYYKPAPVKGSLGGYRAAAAALGAAMHKASNGKGYQPLQFKAALLALAPNAYKGGQWHTWLPNNAHWQAVSK